MNDINDDKYSETGDSGNPIHHGVGGIAVLWHLGKQNNRIDTNITDPPLPFRNAITTVEIRQFGMFGLVSKEKWFVGSLGKPRAQRAGGVRF